MSLTSIKNIKISELDAWGKLSDLGAEIIDGGEIIAFGKMTYGEPNDAISAAYFGTTKGKYRLVYPFSEQSTVVDGEVCITDEATQETRTYRAGDSWFVTKGTATVWEVKSDSFVKHYVAFV